MKDYRTNPDRIDPEHPLAKAARDVNDRTEAKGLDGMVADLGLGVSVAQLAYLAEQRALRAFSARYLGYNMGHHPDNDEQIAKCLVQTDQWKRLSSLITAAYMDGMAIGWRGGQIELEK